MESKKIWRFFLCLALLAAAAGMMARSAGAAPGELDHSFAGFGSEGKVITRGVAMGPGLRGMALQADGKIVVAGYTGIALLVIRYEANGRLDVTFSGDGIATFIHPQFGMRGTSVAVQPDGKLVVAGWTDTNPRNFLLARVTGTGQLDGSFGNSGYVTTDFDNDTDEINAVLVQPDGQIVAAGRARISGDYDFAVARYNADGSPDTSFSGDGKTSIGFGADEVSWDVALQADGKLVLVGGEIGNPVDGDFEVARLNPDGTPDTTFGNDGEVKTGLGSFWEAATAVAVQPDGKIVVAGAGHAVDHPTGCYSSDVKVVRYLANGDGDNSFDGDGKLTIGSLSGCMNDVAVQPDGKIILLGAHESGDDDFKFALYRLNADGTPDATFDGDGRGFYDVGGGDFGKAVALQPDGRIIAYGASDGDHALLRLWPDGSFDTGGRQALGFDDPFYGSGSHEEAFALALQDDGRIILAGDIASANFAKRDFALARFSPDGLPDTSYGHQGRVAFGFGGSEFGNAVVLQPDGKAVVAGSVDSGSDTNFMVARFNANGTPDNSFGFSGFNVLDFLGGPDVAQGVALAPDGKIVAGGMAFNGARTVFGVARFNSDGSVDTSFDVDGKQLFEFDPNLAHEAYAVVVQPDGKIVLGGRLGVADFALVRFNENGSVDGSFGASGTTVTDMGGFDVLRALLLAEDGNFLAAGLRETGNVDFALARYTADGLLDTSFGADGRAFADLGGHDAAYALDVRGDGAIVLAGCSSLRFAVAQFLPDGQIDTAFNGTGMATTDFVGDAECARGVAFAGPDRIVAGGYQVVSGHYNMALARFQTTVDASVPEEAIQGLAAINDGPTQLGQATILTATISAGSNVSYAWAFGDGQTGSGAVVGHVYPAAGTYTATVTATNTVSSLTATTVVTVEAQTVSVYVYLPLLLKP